MYRYFIYILLSVIFNNALYANKTLPIVENGIIDLRNWDFENDGLIELNGEWEFYWNQLLHPNDFTNPEKILLKDYIKVPNNWKGKVINNDKISQFGYATYRLTVLLNKQAPHEYSFDVMYIPTACKIFVNGKLISQHGEVGKTNDETKPGFINKIIDFHIESDTLEIVIQVSNFQFYKAGLAYKFILGEISLTNRYRTKQFGIKLFLIGALLIMFLFFISFYIYRPVEKSSLLFGLFCFMAVIYSFFVDLPHLMLFDDLPFKFQTNIIRYSAYSFPLLLIMFFKEAFPDEHQKWAIWVFGYSAVLLAVLTIFLPIRISSPFMIYYRYIVVLSLGYLVYIIIKAVVRKREGSKVLFIGFTFLFIFIVNDVLYHSEIIKTSNLITFGIIIFITSMSFFLSARFARAYKKKAQLSKELNQINQNLENIVSQRTAETELQKKELRTQTDQLLHTNKRLVEMDKFKEGLTQLIVHDLKSPLGVIASLPDILKVGDDIDIIKKAGGRMLNLVTNILDVHKYENSEIKVEYKDIVVKNIVNDVINQMNSLYSGKKIEIQNNIDSSVKVYADKNLIERVFENLLTNAIKFSPQRGKIKVDAFDNGKMIKFLVKDSGIGIAPEMIDQIFDKFIQVIAKSTGKARSTGLGLTFCKLAVEAHNGKIWVESEEKKGASFFFTLPKK